MREELGSRAFEWGGKSKTAYLVLDKFRTNFKRNYKGFMRETVKCDKFITVDELGRRNHSSSITFEECMSMNMLLSPDARKPLSFIFEKGILTDGLAEYPVNAGIPILHSQKILKALNNEPLKLDYYEDSLVQYYLLSQIKHHFAHNAPVASRPYEKHLFRFSRFCENIGGLVLDIGCDDPRVGATIFPEKCKYIGIDPMMSGDSFRISSIAEILPFSDASFDNVVFNTSLDHILDYHTAIEEASRVLRKDGNIIISTSSGMKGPPSSLIYFIFIITGIPKL